MNPPWRVLVLGCGWVAWQVHLPYLMRLRQAGGLASLHVADIDAGRAAETAAAFDAEIHPLPNTIGALDRDAGDDVVDGLVGDVFGRAGFDLVVVATFPASHAILTIAALAAGAHVIVDKPLALTPADAAAICAASARHRRGVYPLYTLRHRPEAELIRRVLAYDIGPVREVDGAWRRHAGLPATIGGLAEGVLWDLGSHLADVGLYLADWPVTAGVAEGRRTHPATDATDERGRARWQSTAAGPAPAQVPQWCGACADVTLTGPYPDSPQRRLRVEASWSAPVTTDTSRVELVGEGGRLVWRTVFGWSPDRATVPEPCVWVTGPADTTGTGRTASRDETSEAAGAGTRILLTAQPRDPHAEYTAQLDAALAALAGYAVDPGPCAAALRPACATTTVLHAVQNSLDTGTPWDFTTPGLLNPGLIKEEQ